MGLLNIHLRLRLGILPLTQILLAGIISSLTVKNVHLAVLAHRTVKLLHYLVERLSIVDSWRCADPTRWQWTGIRCWISARWHTCSYLQEILLSCLGHYEAHPSHPCIGVIGLILDRILLVCQGSRRLLNHSRVCIRRLSPVHATIVHSVRYQGHRLLSRDSIWLYTLVSLILWCDITCVIWHYSDARSEIRLVLQLDQVDASLMLLVVY